jgi:uncharacterized protein (TIGR00730 family)
MNAGVQPSPRSLCVFCGARSGADARYAQVARETGAGIARRGWTLVFGGGHVGLMGATADAALAVGGTVVGIIPERLMAREAGHTGVTRLEVVPDMATRKDRMIAISDAFVVLPGGLGTLDELFEVLTLRQIGYHDKPTGILNLDGYYDGLLAALSGFARNGLVDPRELDRLIVEDAVERLLDRLGPPA